MIVTCSRCQARFRVADEKVGPRGAKVRCSRCQNVFVVQAAAAPALAAPAPGARPPVPFDLDLTPGIARLRPGAPPAGSVRAPTSPAAADADPFAAAGLHPLSADAGPADDPFARAAGLAPPAPASDDPFAAAAGLAPAAPTAGEPAVDPFALAGTLDDAFAAPAPSGGTGSLPVTDLSQLLGGPAHAPTPPPATLHVVAPAPPPPVAPRGPPAARAAPPPSAAPELTGDLGSLASAGPDLALEERSGPAPVPFADPEDVFAAVNALPSEPAAPPSFSADDAPLALATEPTPGPAGAPPPPAVDHAPAPPAPRAQEARERPHEPAAAGAADAPARAPVAGARRLRAVAVNALSLVALLAIALGFRAAWRGDAAGGAGLLGLAPGRPAADEGPYRLTGVSAGTYDLAAGEQVVFVRGELVAQPGGRPAPVRVHVDLVRDGQVLAGADGLAGAVPTPEEIYAARDEAARAALAAALQHRAPSVAPGARLPFLVVVAQTPPELTGAVVRVHAAAAEGAAP